MPQEREASVQLLETLAPLDGLKRDNTAALANKVTARRIPAGHTLFKEGDTGKRTVRLITGRVGMVEGPSEHQNLSIEGSLNIPLYFRHRCGRRWVERRTPPNMTWELTSKPRS